MSLPKSLATRPFLVNAINNEMETDTKGKVKYVNMVSI